MNEKTLGDVSMETIEMMAEAEILPEASDLVAQARQCLAAKLEQDYLTELSSRAPFAAD
jgi:hypothetical protein